MAGVEIPIFYGLVHNPGEGFHPKAATLLKSMDSLSLFFPSVQRYQLQKLKEKSRSSDPRSNDIDFNSNYINHLTSPYPNYPRINGYFSKSHGHLDTIQKKANFNMTSPTLHDIHIRRYPPEPDELATSASAYSAYDRRPGQEGIDKIPHGFVSRQRELFNRQFIVEPPNDTNSPILCPPESEILRRKSAPIIDSIYVSKDTSTSSNSNSIQTSSISLEIGSSRTTPSPKNSNISEREQRQTYESVPSSSYLIWKTQERLLRKRGSVPTQPSSTPDNQKSLENRPESQSEPTFRTIIMFPGKTSPSSTTSDKNSTSLEKTGNKSKPYKPPLKSTEFMQKFQRTMSNASTATPEIMSSPNTDNSSSPNSTPDLLKINSNQEDVNLSPATIRRNCERIMRIVQKLGCQIPEEEFDSLEGSSSGVSPEMDSNKKTNIWSTYAHSKTDSMKKMSHSNQNLPQSGLHVDIPNFATKPIQTNGLSNGHFENQIIKLKDDEIQRLQQELSEAHVCNQRLNSQIGALASNKSHVAEKELKKQLKEKTNEVDALKKRLEKSERDRKVLESRQPVDVQTLQAQKRELQMQLEREETEKHELFLQINQLIGTLADTRAQEPSKDLQEENLKLKDKLQILESEHQYLKNGSNSSEKSLQNAQNEVLALKDEIQRIRATHDLEKNRLNQEIADVQKELQLRSAALQSLRLAKQEPKEDAAAAAKLSVLSSENSSLKKDLENSKNQLIEANLKLDKSQKSIQDLSVKTEELNQNLSIVQAKLEKAEKLATEKSYEFEKHKQEVLMLGASKSSEIEEFQRSLDEKSKKIDELSKTLSESRTSAESSRTLADELSHKITVASHRIEILEAELKDKNQSYMDIENRLKTLQTELRLAKTGSESKNSELDNFRKQVEELEENIKKSKFDLEGAKEERISLKEQYAKKSSEFDLAQKDIDMLKQKVQNLEKENHRLMEKASVEEELMTLVNSLQASRSEINSKESEIIELRRKFHDYQDEVDKLTADLRHAQTALSHAQEENSRLAGQDVQLSEYRIEAEKRLETVRADLTQEIEQSRSETSQYKGEAQNLKNKCEKLEMELKEIAHVGEIRHSKNQELEVEKKRLETLLEETCEKLKEAENQKRHESDLKSKAEGIVSSLKPLEFQIELKTNELETTQKELASKISELDALKIELAKKNDKFEDLQSEYLALKTVIKDNQTDDAAKLAKIEADLQAQTSVKNQLEEDLRDTLTKLSAAESTLAITENANTTLNAELTDLKSQHRLLNEKIAQFTSDKDLSENQNVELKKRLSEAEAQLSGSSDLAKELVKLKEKLSEEDEKLRVTEKKFSEAQKLIKEKEERLKEEEEKADGYKKLDMEIMVLRTSLGQMQTQFGVNDSEKQELRDKITELTFNLEQRQADHDKLVKSESHNNVLKREKSELEKTLSLMESRLDEAEKALVQQMGAREEELKSRVDVLKIKLSDMEEEKKKSDFELEKAKMEYAEGLRKTQEEANENIRRLTEFLSLEAKRHDDTKKEKETLQLHAENHKREKETLNEKLKIAERHRQEKEELYEKLKELEVELANKPTIVASDEELQQRVNELMEENARLAGDLLKQHRDVISNDEEIRREYEKIIQQRQQEWQRQKIGLESRLDAAETAAGKYSDAIKSLRTEKTELEEEMKKLKMNGSTEPTPKPRKFTASLSNLTFDTMSERSITPSHDEEEIKKLRTELDKQKRLVTVLRKKIQQPQIEAKIQSRTSMSPMGSNGSVTPNRF